MNVAGLSMVSNGIGKISGKVLLILVASILLKAHPGHASVNTWRLTFSVTSTDTSQTPNVFWGKLELTDGDVLPINICGGWDVEVIFNEDVDIETTNDATYISTAINEDNETVHYFTNKAYDSVTNIDGVPTEILNFKGRTDDATSITATAMLIEKYHPPLDEVCTNGTTYTVTSARWSGGSEAGLSMLIQVPVDEDIVGGWELQVKFTEPLTLFNLANVNIEADDNNEVYTITNCCHWNSDIDAGSTIDLPITVKYRPDYCPQFCAELCDGSDTCVPVCPEGWVYHGSSCYKPINIEYTYQQAQNACEQEDAVSYVAVVNDAAENAFVDGIILGGDIWLGCTAFGGNHLWTCPDGSAKTYDTNTRTASPADSYWNWAPTPSQPEINREQCQVQYQRIGMIGEWHDYPCSNTFRVVCELAVSGSEPTTSTSGSTGNIPESIQGITPENTSGSTSETISGTVPYFNRWQTIVIAVSPSSIAALILLCMLFALYCVTPYVLRKDEDKDDSKVLEVDVVVDVNEQVHLDRYQQSSIEAPDDTNA